VFSASSCYNMFMGMTKLWTKVSRCTKTFGVAVAGLAVVGLALFSSGTLSVEPAAGASNQGSLASVLAPSLTVSPTTAVPNQSIAIIGSGFTPASTAGGGGPNGVHQITGQGTSFVIVAANLLGPPHITYPINLDSGGAFVAPVFVPVNTATLAGGTITVTATDAQGVTATATFTVPQRTLELEPDETRRGSTVTATGKGFPASNLGLTGFFSVNIDYAGISLTSVTPDSSGDFEINFQVPPSALIPSTNTVSANIVGNLGSSIATHSVPAASISIAPNNSSPGSTVTVTGSNFPAFAPVSSLTFGNVQAMPSPSPTTDRNGAFTSNVLVPDLPAGNQRVLGVAGNIMSFTSFTVSAPSISPALTVVGLSPLLDSDNLVRVWTFNKVTKEWTFFDPRPAFAPANTITQLVPGGVYWLNLIVAQMATLNFKQRSLSAGWNLLSW